MNEERNRSRQNIIIVYFNGFVVTINYNFSLYIFFPYVINNHVVQNRKYISFIYVYKYSI